MVMSHTYPSLQQTFENIGRIRRKLEVKEGSDVVDILSISVSFYDKDKMSVLCPYYQSMRLIRATSIETTQQGPNKAMIACMALGP